MYIREGRSMDPWIVNLSKVAARSIDFAAEISECKIAFPLNHIVRILGNFLRLGFVTYFRAAQNQDGFWGEFFYDAYQIQTLACIPNVYTQTKNLR